MAKQTAAAKIPSSETPILDAINGREAPSSFVLLGEEFLTTEQVAQMLGRSNRSVCAWRERKMGPCYIKVGKVILYRRSQVLKWLLDNEVSPKRGRKAQ